MMTVCLLQLSIISLNCYNINLDSNSDELHDLSLKILFVGNHSSNPYNTDITVHNLLELIL